MQYSLNMLKKMISIQDTPESIANHLTLKTCEIEGIHKRVLPREVVIGKVKSVRQHPQADKLKVCEVDCGTHGIYTICTGGENIAENFFVPVALPGCYLPVIDLKIEPRKLRGEDSNGMICSKGELGINEDEEHHWIRLLDEDIDDCTDNDCGTPLAEKYPWLENIIFDVDNKTLTHRPDLTGHRGLSRELNTIYHLQEKRDGKKYILFNQTQALVDAIQPARIEEVLKHATPLARKVISKTDDLRSYVLLSLRDVKVKRSSLLTRIMMLDAGLQSRNNWIDISNLFMHVSGHPVHFFDADKVEGNIVVRNANPGEQFVDLFETVHILDDQDIVICDEKKILALAGVVGGKNSGVNDDTQNILVEIANFDPVKVRKTGVKYNLRTDAEIRFEKNIHPVYTLGVVQLLLDELMYFSKDLGSFSIEGVSTYIGSFAQKYLKNPPVLSCSYQEIQQFIFGESRPEFEKIIQDIIKGLGGSIQDNNEKIDITLPLWRSPTDLTIKQDIYEEIVRIYGYDQVTSKTFVGPVQYQPYESTVELQRSIEEIAVRNYHFDQVETYPWTEKQWYQIFAVDTQYLYELQNTTAPEYNYLRNSLKYNLLEAVKKNKAFFDECRMMDIGKVWYDRKESLSLGCMIYQKELKDWKSDPIGQLKQLIQDIVGMGYGVLSFGLSQDASFHPKKQATIMINGIVCGVIGQFHPLITQHIKIADQAYCTYMEVNLDLLIASQIEKKHQFPEYYTLQDQLITRDLCFVIDKNQSFDLLLNTIKQLKEIKKLEVFDIYEGDKLPVGKKSLAFTFTIQGDGTMTNDQINEIMNHVISIAKTLGAELRA